jgi:hypothetical protein
MKMARGRTVAPTVAAILASLVGLLETGVAPVHANDSSAAIAAGGLELIKNDQVRMISETLRIAPRLVEVDYVFENTSSADVTTEVAFPLPDLDQTVAYNEPLNIPFKKDTNFVGFQIWTDGKEIKPAVEVRAFAKGGEITTELGRLGVDPVNPRLDSPVGVDAGVIETLHRLDAIYEDQYNTFATWTTKVIFHWLQTFPAGKRIMIRHRYRPIYGSSYIQNDDPRTRVTKNDQKLGGQWCFDQSFNTAELRLLDRQYEAAIKNKNDVTSDFHVYHDQVQYVLKTGANWQGPIGRFELQIDKGGADLVSTCPIPGLQLQPTPYGFNAVASNYTPTSNLDILFVSGRWLGPPNGSDDPKR